MEVKLSNRTLDHVIIFWNKTQDDEIKNLFPGISETLKDSIVLFEESLKDFASSFGKVIYYNEKYIGDIWCYGIDDEIEKMAMLSIVIFEKDLWGQGIGTEAIKLFIREVKIKYEIKKLGAFVYSNNYGSIGVLKKTGFMEIEEFIEDGIQSKYFELML